MSPCRVEAHLKPIAIATNILQTPHTRLDHVLGTLANLFRIYNSDSMEAEASAKPHMNLGILRSIRKMRKMV